jgi:hypothetical protein
MSLESSSSLSRWKTSILFCPRKTMNSSSVSPAVSAQYSRRSAQGSRHLSLLAPLLARALRWRLVAVYDCCPSTSPPRTISPAVSDGVCDFYLPDAPSCTKTARNRTWPGLSWTRIVYGTKSRLIAVYGEGTHILRVRQRPPVQARTGTFISLVRRPVASRCLEYLNKIIA